MNSMAFTQSSVNNSNNNKIIIIQYKYKLSPSNTNIYS